MPQTTYCNCIRITRTDGTILTFTSNDRNVEFGGQIYYASRAVDAIDLVKDIELSTDNVTFKSILDYDGVTAKDILNGKYQDAVVVMAKIDYLNPPVTLLEGEILLSGRIGKIEFTDSIYTMEVRGLSALLNQGISIKTSPICRWSFGDEKCQVDLAPLTFTGTVSGIVSNKELTTDLNPNRTLEYGKLEFTSGLNQGLIYTLAGNTAGRLNLISAMQYPPEPGDTIRAIAGCKRDQWTCRDAYNNLPRFGGELVRWSPDSGFFPGNDKLIFPDRE